MIPSGKDSRVKPKPKTEIKPGQVWVLEGPKYEPVAILQVQGWVCQFMYMEGRFAGESAWLSIESFKTKFTLHKSHARPMQPQTGKLSAFYRWSGRLQQYRIASARIRWSPKLFIAFAAVWPLNFLVALMVRLNFHVGMTSQFKVRLKLFDWACQIEEWAGVRFSAYRRCIGLFGLVEVHTNDKIPIAYKAKEDETHTEFMSRQIKEMGIGR